MKIYPSSRIVTKIKDLKVGCLIKVSINFHNLHNEVDDGWKEKFVTVKSIDPNGYLEIKEFKNRIGVSKTTYAPCNFELE